MPLNDTVNFTRFKSKYTLAKDKCKCGGTFQVVVLEKSDRATLHVECCECDKHTTASSKRKCKL